MNANININSLEDNNNLSKEIEDDSFLTGIDELNITEFPLVVTSQRPIGDSVSYSDSILCPRTKKTIERSLTISNPKKEGLPSPVDSNVLLAVLQLKDRLTENNVVEFRMHELLEIYGLAQTGGNIERVKKSLDKWYDLDLEYKNAWYNRAAKQWMTTKFSVISEISMSEDGLTYIIKLGDPFASNLHLNYFKSLDLNQYYSLKSSLAQVMYRFIDKKFLNKDKIDYNLDRIAFNHFGIPANKRFSALKSAILEACSELEAIGFIAKDPSRIYKTRRDWRIKFAKFSYVDPDELFSASIMDDSFSDLEVRYKSKGVSKPKYNEWVAEFGLDCLLCQMEHLEFILFKGDSIIKNPSGWLFRMNQKNEPLPSDFVSRAERLAIQEKKDEKRRDVCRDIEEKAKESSEDNRIFCASVETCFDKLSEVDKSSVNSYLDISPESIDSETAQMLYFFKMNEALEHFGFDYVEIPD